MADKNSKINDEMKRLKELKECSDETLSIFWKTQLWKIRDFWNEITEKNFFFYIQRSVFLIFVKIWTPVCTFYDVNNEHMFWRLLENCYCWMTFLLKLIRMFAFLRLRRSALILGPHPSAPKILQEQIYE